MGWACACAFSAAIKMADYALAVQCWNRSSFATEHFQRKPHKFFDLRCPLSTRYRFQDEQTLQRRLTDTHTHTHTDKPTTVTLAAHARRGLTMIDIPKYTSHVCVQCIEVVCVCVCVSPSFMRRIFIIVYTRGHP